MKSSFILTIFTFGTFICATCLTPTRADSHHSATNKGLLLELLNQITKSQLESEGDLYVNQQTTVAETRKNRLQKERRYKEITRRGNRFARRFKDAFKRKPKEKKEKKKEWKNSGFSKITEGGRLIGGDPIGG